MIGINRETFCVLSYIDKARVYLYYTKRPITAKVLSTVTGVPVKDIYRMLKTDVRNNHISRTKLTPKHGRICYHYYITPTGLKTFKNKRQFLCIIPPKIKGVLDFA